MKFTKTSEEQMFSDAKVRNLYCPCVIGGEFMEVGCGYQIGLTKNRWARFIQRALEKGGPNKHIGDELPEGAATRGNFISIWVEGALIVYQDPDQRFD